MRPSAAQLFEKSEGQSVRVVQLINQPTIEMREF
jgi:hypothetical protein